MALNFLNIFGKKRKDEGVPVRATLRRMGELTGAEIARRGTQGEVMDAHPFGTWIDISSEAVAQAMFEPYTKPKEGGFWQRLGFSQKVSNGILWIRFRSGPKRYAYPMVPYKVWQEFMNAPSKGQFVHYVLKRKYAKPYTRARRVVQAGRGAAAAVSAARTAATAAGRRAAARAAGRP